jgi:hypothetical protein
MRISFVVLMLNHYPLLCSVTSTKIALFSSYLIQKVSSLSLLSRTDFFLLLFRCPPSDRILGISKWGTERGGLEEV